MEERTVALANNLLLFFASVAVGGIMLAVLQGPFDQIAAAGTNISTTSEAAQGQQFVEDFWDLLPFIISALGLVQLLAAAVVEGRVP
jgi:hypothetical protein